MDDLETPTRQIDHIVIRKKEKKRMIDCNTENSIGVRSDHVPIALTIRTENKIPKKKKKKGRKKKKDKTATTDEENNDDGKNRKKKKDYSRIVPNKKEWNELIAKNLLNETNTPPPNNETEDDNPNPPPQTAEEEDHYSLLQEVIETSTEELLATIEEVNRKRPNWFVLSENKLKKGIEERNETLRKYMKEKNDDNKKKAKTKRKELKTMIYEAKERWLNTKAEEIESKQTNPRDIWKALNETKAGEFGHQIKAVTVKMKKSDGTFAKNDIENAKVFQQHNTKLYNNTSGTDYDKAIIDTIEDNQPVNKELGITPTRHEVETAFKKMAYEKSPGSNGITTEAFKNLDGDGFELLYRTIVRYWTDENYTQEEFTTIKLSMIPKTGNLSNPNKWRGIALGDIAAKSVSSIIAYRLTQHLCTFGMDEQCGSLFGKGCVDATFTLKKALQQLREQGQNTHVLFVDLVKAYDSVNRELLWKILNKYGVTKETITVLKKLHTNVKYLLRVGKEKVEIEATVGVIQGNNLGPILFIYLIQAVATTLDKEMRKANIKQADFRSYRRRKDGKFQHNPSLSKATDVKNKGTEFNFDKSFYVDDAAFIFLSRDDIEKGGKLIQSHFRKFGLTVHAGDKTKKDKSKTEAMFIPGAGKKETTIDEEADIMIGEHKFYSYTKKFKYLGSIFTSSLKDDEDIKRRISQACGAFAQAEKVLCNHKLQTTTRIRFYEATVVNLLLWGCESWALTKEQKRKLEVCHHRALRKMAGITIFDVKEKHITNKQVRERLGNCRSLHQLVEITRTKWLQKLATMKHNRKPKKILKCWIFKTPRPVGRRQECIETSLSKMITNSLELKDNLNDWMTTDKAIWQRRITAIAM